MFQRLSSLILVLLAGVLSVAAQPLAGGSPESIAIVRVGVLPDRHYSWAQIRTDTTLAFAPADSLQLAQARCFWLKLVLVNRSRYAVAGQLAVLPNLDNTLFYFDEDAQAWLTHRAGFDVATDAHRLKGQLPLLLQGRAATTCYVRVNLHPPASLPRAIRLRVTLEKEQVAQEQYLFFSIAWAVSLTVLLLLLLSNLHAYYRFRDRPTLYYLWMHVGGGLYITAFRGFFKLLLPTPIFSLLVLPSGLGYSYTLNNLLMHLSVVVLLLGLVQMTRAYLQTKRYLPRLDARLRYALGGYLVFSAVVALVNLSGFYLDNYSLLYDNLLVFAVIGLLLATSLVAYQRRLPAARTYLIANALPLVMMICLVVYHVVISFTYQGNLLLPDLVIVAHALCFSAALGTRLHLLQQSLLTKEREADHLALDIRQQELRHREIVLKNTHIQAAMLELQHRQQAREQHTRQLSADHQQQQTANQDLRQQLEANQRELASTTLYVQQKNALLAELKQQIQELNAQSPARQNELSGIKSILQTSLYLDEDWARFKLHFEQVHPRFFEDLQARYPALTKNELRLYSYFHINLATKEIAALLNIDPASVRRAKTRLYKKIATADQVPGPNPPEAGMMEPQPGA